MSKHSFLIGSTQAVLPVDSNDILWFGKALKARNVDLRAKTSPAIEAARDLGILVHAATLMAAQVPDGVHVQAQAPKTFDLGLAAAVCSLIRTLRRMEARNPKLFEACWAVVFGGAPIAVPQKQTPDRDHVWEFLNAAVCSEFAVDVAVNQLDAGVDVSGGLRGGRWGVECKVVYTGNIQRRIDRIIDGAKQIEADQTVDKGVVAVNVTNLVDHGPFRRALSGQQPFRTLGDATAVLAAEVKRVVRETATPTMHKRLVEDKHGNPRRKCRAVVFVGQTVTLAGGRVEVFTSQFSMLRKPAEVPDKVFVNRYHRGWFAGRM
jgi:hypothetical protein